MSKEDLLKIWQQRAKELHEIADNERINFPDRIEAGAKANQLLQCMLDIKQFLEEKI
jgi:hypothetical protein